MILTHFMLTPIETLVSPRRLLFFKAVFAMSPFVISAGLSKSGYKITFSNTLLFTFLIPIMMKKSPQTANPDAIRIFTL